MGNRSILRWCIFVLLTALLAWNPTEFRTPVTVDYDGQVLRFTVLASTIEVSRPGLQLERLALRTGPSVFPIGGGPVQISGEGMEPVQFALPAHFEFNRWKVRALGDWYLDDADVPEQLWEQPFQNKGAFHLTTSITGRCLLSVHLDLVGKNGVDLSFRRGLMDNDMIAIDPTGRVLGNSPIQPAWTKSLLNIFDPYLRGIWWALAVLVFLPSRLNASLTMKLEKWSRSASLAWLWLVLLHTVLVIGIAGWVLEAMPHFQDDLCYLLRAKWLLTGHLSQPVPALIDHFNIPYTYVAGEKWSTYYPIGWPVLLAMGQVFGAAWLASPLCSALSLIVLWHLGNKMGGRALGWIVLLLSTTCLLGWVLSASMMTHAASAWLLALSVLGYWRGEEEKSWKWSLLGGSALGFLFTMRPLTSVAAGLVFALFALPKLRRNGREIFCFGLGGLMMSAVALWDNAQVTGSPWVFAYSAGFGYEWTWSTLTENLLVSDATMALILPHAFGWDWFPQTGLLLAGMGLGLVLLPFVSGAARRIEWLLLALFVSVPVAYSGISMTGAHGFGPRYYYDVFFCLFLLAGQGFRMMQRFWTWIRSPLPGRLWLAFGLVLLIFSGIRAARNIGRYQGYNYVNAHLVRVVDTQVRRPALVLLNPPGYLQWIRAAPRLQASLDDDLVFAGELEDNTALLKRYEGRAVYRWYKGRMFIVHP